VNSIVVVAIVPVVFVFIMEFSNAFIIVCDLLTAPLDRLVELRVDAEGEVLIQDVVWEDAALKAWLLLALENLQPIELTTFSGCI